MNDQSDPAGTATVSLADLDAFCRAVLTAVGADEATVDASARAMLHGTRFGVDSHGVRLLAHYVNELEGGRTKKRPTLTFPRSFGAVAALDGGNAHGPRATYAAMDKAIELADEFGIGAVGIANSAHFAAAGAYAMAAADRGFIGYACCNADNVVKLHGGAAPFHSTNPHAWAMPRPDGRHWFLDMATSAIPFNRVLLYRSLDRSLPEGVAADSAGNPTTSPHEAAMLMPLGGDFGYKGAGLAGVAELMSAVLNGMALSSELIPMAGPDLATPRPMGAFVMALKVDAFADRDTVDATMSRYLGALRGSPTQPGETVMAPGDREWKVADLRDVEGVPLDPATHQAFVALAARYGVALPASITDMAH